MNIYPSGANINYPLDIWPKERDIKDCFNIKEITEEKAKDLPDLNRGYDAF